MIAMCRKIFEYFITVKEKESSNGDILGTHSVKA